MDVTSLDGKIQKWKFKTINSEFKSDLHKTARSLIKEIYPTITIEEEIQIEVKKNKYLYLDFYLPLFKIGIEIDGQQHTKYNNFLNKNPYHFMKQKLNDKLKEQWCELNSIILIRLGYNEKQDEWRTKLLSFGIHSEKRTDS